MGVDSIHTFCRICEPGCGLVADVADGAVTGLRPDAAHPVHKGFCCHKGIHYLDVHNDPDRLDRPLKRVNDRSADEAEFVPTDWDSAAREIADTIADIRERHGTNALAIYQGNPSAFNGAYFANAGAFARGFGTRTRFSAGTQDTSAKYAASEAIYGSATSHPIPDLLHTDYFLCLGSNPRVSHMTLIHVSDPYQKLKDIKHRGGTVLFVNPRKIESSTPETGDVLQVRPDSDFYLLAGLLNEIVFHIGFDRDEVTAHARNVDRLLDFVARYPVERVAPVVGVEPDAIRQIARDFCAAPSASIYMATGVNQGRQGALAYWMLTMISLWTGNLGRRGGNIYSRGMADTVQNARRRRDDPYFDHPLGDMRTVSGDLPGAMLADFIESPTDPIRALIVVSGNPLLSMGGEQRLREAFGRLELIVSIDLYRNLTGELADFVLPATDWLEREDFNFLNTMGVALEPYVQYTPAVVAPTAERRDDWWILARILQAMGMPTLLDDPEPNPWDSVDALLAESGLSIAALAAKPGHTHVLPEAVPSDVFSLAVQHDDGLIDCCPALFARSYDRAEQILHGMSSNEGELVLITRRTNYMVNSWLHNLPVLKHGPHMTNPLWIHPDDATDRHLVDGDEVIVQNSSGSIRAVAVLDEDLRPGVVAMTHGWGHARATGLDTARHHAGVNVNVLAPTGRNGFDELSNQSHLTGIGVDVQRR